MLLLIFLLLLPSEIVTQDCNSAPSPSIKHICEQITMWDTKARTVPSTSRTATAPGIAGLAATAVAVPTVPSNAYDCMDIGCICGFFGGSGGSSCTLRNGQRLSRGIRKEYRVLTNAERQSYNTAMWTIKSNGDYDELSRIHSSFQTSPGAHSGPAFMPWHREYLKRLEIALRRVDPSVSIPYWDSTLDGSIPDPRQSILWGNELMGSPDADQQVRTGAFRNWRTVDGSRTFRRQLGAQPSLFTQADIDAVMAASDVNQVLANTAPRAGCPTPATWNALEYNHGKPHNFAGGDMLITTTSTNDPLFFNHHSFVDFIWEQWRLSRQTRASRETSYPVSNVNCHSEAHFGQNSMAPFSQFTNRDGLLNAYTDNLYTYQDRPTCSSNNINQCGSRFLFCDLSHGAARCASKIQNAGNCAGYTRNEDSCYQGRCVNGRCIAAQPQPTTQPPIVTTTPSVPNVDGTCFNENECCAPWSSRGECTRNPSYMRQWCPAVCGYCSPKYDPSIECADRHSMCSQWAQRGECEKNPLWMRENCRQSCRRCGTTRAQACPASNNTPAPRPTESRPITVAPSNSCLNKHYCCEAWAAQNFCSNREYSSYMASNCQPSCRRCNGPRGWNSQSCSDLHPSCYSWARNNECSRTQNYMLENCRKSCNRCDLADYNNRLAACGYQSNNSGGRGGGRLLDAFGRVIGAISNPRSPILPIIRNLVGSIRGNRKPDEIKGQRSKTEKAPQSRSLLLLSPESEEKKKISSSNIDKVEDIKKHKETKEHKSEEPKHATPKYDAYAKDAYVTGM